MKGPFSAGWEDIPWPIFLAIPYNIATESRI
jgi:hypothetical protein